MTLSGIICYPFVELNDGSVHLIGICNIRFMYIISLGAIHYSYYDLTLCYIVPIL